jgi:acetyl esterase
VDGNEIEVLIRRPKNAQGALPCVCHLHGGGMAMMSIHDDLVVSWTSQMARIGLIVASIEFRNCGGKLGRHPFPAGLNDCCSAVEWLYAGKEKLSFTSLTLMGESGGANLSIATAMKLKDKSIIDGVFAACPYISNAYKNPKESGLLSLVENNDYTLEMTSLAANASIYTITEDDETNPLAWPSYATEQDLKGMPPHFISLNELDPLRDEGKAFYHKLVEAGVPCSCHIVCGTEHAGQSIFGHSIPEVHLATFYSIKGFAESVASK